MATVDLDGTTFDSADLADGGHRDPDVGFFAILTAFVAELAGAETANSVAAGAIGGFLQSDGAAWTRAGYPRLSSVTSITPGAQQDNLAIGDFAVVRATPSAAIDLTGMASPVNGRTLLLLNLSDTHAITVKHESASSTAANRFDLEDDADFDLSAGRAALFWYDSTSSRWRLVALTSEIPSLGSAGQVMRVNAAGSALEFAGGMTKIAETTLGSAAAAITFSSIPAVYKHLLVIISARSTTASATVTALMRFNGDSGSNFDTVKLLTIGASATPSEVLASDQMQIGEIPGASAGSNLFGQIEVLIADYASTSKEKSARAKGTGKWGVTADDFYVTEAALAWRSTAAISTVRIGGGASLDAGTIVSLYGIA